MDGISISRLISVGAVVPLGHCPFDSLHLETQNESAECLKAMSSKNERVLPLRERFWVQKYNVMLALPPILTGGQ